MEPPYSQRQISRSSARTYFMPPAAMPSSFATSCHISASPLVRWELRQAVRIGDRLVHEEPAPAALHLVEMLALEGDAGAADLHVLGPVARPHLARAEGGAEVLLELDLRLQELVGQCFVGGELVAHRADDPVEQVAQGFLAFSCAHVLTPPTLEMLEELVGVVAHDRLAVDDHHGEAAAAAELVSLLGGLVLLLVGQRVDVDVLELDPAVREPLLGLAAPGARAQSVDEHLVGHRHAPFSCTRLSLIHISEPTRLGMISYAVF